MQSDIKTIRKEQPSPLAEGRELKYFCRINGVYGLPSPLAEGRELKFVLSSPSVEDSASRPSRRGVN